MMLFEYLRVAHWRRSTWLHCSNATLLMLSFRHQRQHCRIAFASPACGILLFGSGTIPFLLDSILYIFDFVLSRRVRAILPECDSR